jgi:hypothetical protein
MDKGLMPRRGEFRNPIPSKLLNQNKLTIFSSGLKF